MAEAVTPSMHDGSHLLVQAGTGTGKSLGYLVPALLHAIEDRRVVVSTATLALQSQLVDRDVPRPPRRHREAPAAQTVVRDPEGPQQLRLPAPDPRGRAGRRRHAHRRPAARPDRPAGARAARLGRAATARRRGRRPRPRARRTSTRPGSRSRSPPASASARRNARTARSASPRRPRTRPARPTSSSRITRCSRSTPSRTARSCPSTTWSSSTRRTSCPPGSPAPRVTSCRRRWSSGPPKRSRRFVDDDKADDLIDASDALRAALDGVPRRPDRGLERSGARSGRAGPRRRPRAVLRPEQEVRRQGRRPRRRQAAVEGRGQGDLRRRPSASPR